MPQFLMGVNEITQTHVTSSLNGHLKVKNTMVKAVFYVTEHTVWSVVAVHRILQVPRVYKCSGLRSGDLGGQCCRPP
jgi:uncharacterized protein YabE (DUF348 family)